MESTFCSRSQLPARVNVCLSAAGHTGNFQSDVAAPCDGFNAHACLGQLLSLNPLAQACGCSCPKAGRHKRGFPSASRHATLSRYASIIFFLKAKEIFSKRWEPLAYAGLHPGQSLTRFWICTLLSTTASQQCARTSSTTAMMSWDGHFLTDSMQCM